MSDKIASQIEQESGRKLTNRQREFAKYYVEGRYSNAECARKAGFVGENVHIYASKLLNGREHPQVLEYVKELREEKERRYGVTLIELRGPLIGAYFYSRAVVRVLWRLRAYVREPFFREPRSSKLWTRSEVLVWSIWLESCGPAALRRHKKARTGRAGFLDLEDQDSV
jgi:hypothetical protein